MLIRCAFARIWRVYIHSRLRISLVDAFPAYATVEDNPPYKSVKDIYYEYFTELDEALNSSAIALSLYSRMQVSTWSIRMTFLLKKFGNSLRLRSLFVYLRWIERNVVAEANAALTSPCGLISSKADNAYMPQKRMVLWGQDYNYTMFQITWSGPICMSKSFGEISDYIGNIRLACRRGKPDIRMLRYRNVHPAKVDPRAPKMFQPGIENGDWKGLVYGAKAGGGEYWYLSV